MPRIYTTLLCSCISLLSFISGPVFSSDQDGMRQYQLDKLEDGKGYAMVMKTAPVPVPAANEVLVRMRAVSLNRKDIYFRDASLQSGKATPGMSISDGAGDVVAVGKDVTRFKAGDRVVGAFDTIWVDGPQKQIRPREGLLSDYVVMTEDTALPIPAYMSYEEASTLPCAAVTAWNTLFESASLKAGEYVLLEGTGGVSVFGLQLAVAAGARPIITSSSDEKLAQARALGAFGTINYRKNPDWDVVVRKLSNNVGVKHVLEVGGKDTFPKAVASLAMGGHIGSIGGLAEGGFVRQEVLGRGEEGLDFGGELRGRGELGDGADVELLDLRLELAHQVDQLGDQLVDLRHQRRQGLHGGLDRVDVVIVVEEALEVVEDGLELLEKVLCSHCRSSVKRFSSQPPVPAAWCIRLRRAHMPPTRRRPQI